VTDPPAVAFGRLGLGTAPLGLDGSLQRLDLDRVDVALIHDPDDHCDEAFAGAYPALARETEPDCFLVAGRYTLRDRSAEERLLPLFHERGIAVIAGGVFKSGARAGAAQGTEAGGRGVLRMGATWGACSVLARIAKCGRRAKDVPMRLLKIAAWAASPRSWGSERSSSLPSQTRRHSPPSSRMSHRRFANAWPSGERPRPRPRRRLRQKRVGDVKRVPPGAERGGDYDRRCDPNASNAWRAR
jgi:hypothetical protein